MPSLKARLSYQRRHKEAGLCVNCPRPAIPNQIHCLRCTEYRSKQKKQRRLEHPEVMAVIDRKKVQDRMDKSLCTTCGGPKDDPQWHKCINCRLKLFRPIGSKYATYNRKCA
jgi:hypothetical protein